MSFELEDLALVVPRLPCLKWYFMDYASCFDGARLIAAVHAYWVARVAENILQRTYLSLALPTSYTYTCYASMHCIW